MSVSSVISPGSRWRLGDRWTGGARKVSHSSNSLRTQFARVHSCIIQRKDSHANMGTRTHTHSQRESTSLDSRAHLLALRHSGTCTRFVTQHTVPLPRRMRSDLQGGWVKAISLAATLPPSAQAGLQRQITVSDRYRRGRTLAATRGINLRLIPNPLSTVSFQALRLFCPQSPSHKGLLTLWLEPGVRFVPIATTPEGKEKWKLFLM